MPPVLLDRMKDFAAGRALLWLDHFDYTSRVLAGGRIPWLDTAAFLAYYRRAQSLLKPGVAVAPFERFFAAWLDVHPELKTEMAARCRSGFALKTLLAAAGPRELLAGTVAAMRAVFPATPLVLSLPSPRRWLVWADARAGGGDLSAGTVDDEGAETAAMYVADFLRVFAEARVDGLLLEETPGYRPAGHAWREYQPVINLARHYRWDLGLQALFGAGAQALALPIGGDGKDATWDFVITDAALPPAIRRGIVLGESFWAGAAPPALASPGFYFARIPDDAVPERVLERLSAAC